MIYNPSWSLVSSGPTPRHPSHQQIFWSRSISAGSANIYKIAKTSGDQHRHNLCKCRHSPHLLTGLQPQSREALVCGKYKDLQGIKKLSKYLHPDYSSSSWWCSSSLRTTPTQCPASARWHELARLTSLAEHTQRGQERPGSDVDSFSKTVIILVNKLVSGVVYITQDRYTSHLVN